PGRPYVQMADRRPVDQRLQLLRPPRFGRRLLRRARPRRLPAPAPQARPQGRLLSPGPQPAQVYFSSLSLATRTLAAWAVRPATAHRAAVRYLSSRRVGAVRPHGRHERPLVGPPSAPPVSCGFRGGTAVLRVDAVPSPSPLARGFCLAL